ALTFALGVYGGFFSGGYVTMLTALFVALLRMTFVQAVSTTKIVNVFSSLVATIVFMARGLVDYKLGVLLGLAMFVGAFVGARVTLRLNNVWIRRIFLGTVVLLALKILLYDFLWKGLK
ncbi:MAG: sulfite exporter TauE/SafE family protein, partial [Acidobacteria bacterium]|nr:sulfite exporter TauE/SafE family protein [Acidobacteriota bacterium]